LYDAGRGPEESRLRVALDVLQMKARWTNTRADDLLEYKKKPAFLAGTHVLVV
jgi:hypothetical protein